MYGASVFTARMIECLSGVGDRLCSVDAGVVYDGIHSADRIHLIRDPSGLVRTAEVTDHHARRMRHEISECSRALLRASKQDDLMALHDECLRCCATGSVRASCDKYTRHDFPYGLADIRQPRNARNADPQSIAALRAKVLWYPRPP